MHKHFRMIAISQHLRNHGYTSSKDSHTRIPGIWQKLGSLYNLEALDERVGCILRKLEIRLLKHGAQRKTRWVKTPQTTAITKRSLSSSSDYLKTILEITCSQDDWPLKAHPHLQLYLTSF